MSGIAVALFADGRPADHSLIDRMAAAMVFRGPDGIAIRTDGPLAMAHCRQCTTAESLEECQPAHSADSPHLLAMDGYFANCDDLRRDLEAAGARLRNRSDAELALRGLEVWGREFFCRAEGEFALVAWDGSRREVILARDHHGLRPLFYHWDGIRLLVASDMAAVIAALGQEPPLNSFYLAEIASDHWYSRTQTIYHGICRVEAGHVTVAGPAGLQHRQYWQVPLVDPPPVADEDDYIAQYRAMLEECVRQACRSHLPVGCEVSGGLDSSALLALARNLQRQGRLPAPEVRAYTLATPPDSAADERHYLNLLAGQLELPLSEVELFTPPLDWFRQTSRETRDMPVYPNGAMSIMLERRQAADGCRVSINGNGGDQWLDGTPYAYARWLAAGRVGHVARNWRGDAARLGARRASSRLLHFGLLPLLPAGIQALLRGLRNDAGETPVSQLFWLSDSARAELHRRQQDRARSLPAHGPFRVLAATATFPYWTLALDLMSAQRARNGIEMRSPMLSRRFIEFMARTPEELKLRDGTRRYLHRRAMDGLLPSQIAWRETKAEFSASVSPDRAEVANYCRRVLASHPHPALDARGTARLLTEYCNAAIDQRGIWELWGIYVVAALSDNGARSKGRISDL